MSGLEWSRPSRGAYMDATHLGSRDRHLSFAKISETGLPFGAWRIGSCY